MKSEGKLFFLYTNTHTHSTPITWTFVSSSFFYIFIRFNMTTEVICLL